MLENWARLSGFAAILAAVLAISFLWTLNYVPPQNTEWTCEAKPDSNDPSKPALNTFTCHTKQSENLESQPARANKQSDQNASDGIKITDVFLAAFNGLLVIVTAVLIAVGISQGRELRRAVDASKDEFVANHRPKVRLKHLWLMNDIWSGEKIVLELTMVNNGTAEGIGAEVGIRIHIVRADRPLPPDPSIPAIANLGGQKLVCGKNLTLRGLDTGITLTDPENTAIQNGRSKLYCVGYISYLDGADRMRITGFCRVLTFPPNIIALAGNSRFRRFRDPDYEYED
jgi:hypothetical protein